jgi:DNA polymerase-3 subunit alpha
MVATNKYGSDHVAQIITFGTLGARAAIRDAGRALGMPYGDVDRVARLVPFAPGITLERALEENAELNGIYQQDLVVKNLVDSARGIGGIARHASTHAAGVVISREPLTLYTALQRSSRGGNGQGALMTQLDMGDIARIGLLKMDFLGLANLTILGKARELVSRNRGQDIDLRTIPMDDAKTFKLLSSGETTGVFQLEGAGMRRNIKALKPTIFSDIAAMVALYRPGPMEQIPRFIDAKHGREPIRYPHPALASLLEETYGVIVYQEQVLHIVQTFAGYSLGQADIFRKAMGKKIPQVMRKEKRNFIAGAKENGFSVELAGQVFALIEPFAGYAFNKAHAVSYALIAYQTAYLKANYPAEYMTAFLITQFEQKEKVATAVAECRRLGINILPPDINHCQLNFCIEPDDQGVSAIRFGLTAIKNVGPGAVEPIIAERVKGGTYESIEDLCRRADLSGINKRVMESLIKAGALDRLGNDRGTLLANIGRILALAGQQQHLRDTGQTTMFDLFGETAAVPMPSLEMAQASISKRDKLAWEKELMGVYLSEHPFSAYASNAGNTTLCGQIDAELDGQTVSAAGVVTSLRSSLTREGSSFLVAGLEDLSGGVEVIVWPRTYARSKELWQEGNVLKVDGQVKVRGDRVQLYAEQVHQYKPPEEEEEKKALPVPAEELIAETPPQLCRLIISLNQSDDQEGDLARLHQVYEALRDFPGRDEVNLSIVKGNEVVLLKLPDGHADYCPQLRERLVELVGEEGLRLEKSG